ncbi:hypothetical protein C8R44DRAFT_851572 [Mycena epipterygia]|nr:hypothetical protein C8R44DRAFT_851572 [Mycena epipterygia]
MIFPRSKMGEFRPGRRDNIDERRHTFGYLDFGYIRLHSATFGYTHFGHRSPEFDQNVIKLTQSASTWGRNAVYTVKYINGATDSSRFGRPSPLPYLAKKGSYIRGVELNKPLGVDLLVNVNPCESDFLGKCWAGQVQEQPSCNQVGASSSAPLNIVDGWKFESCPAYGTSDSTLL